MEPKAGINRLSWCPAHRIAGKPLVAAAALVLSPAVMSTASADTTHAAAVSAPQAPAENDPKYQQGHNATCDNQGPTGAPRVCAANCRAYARRTQGTLLLLHLHSRPTGSTVTSRRNPP
jgi:hypothetical protein